MAKSDWCTAIILCFVNLVNYMDRFTIAGVLQQIQDYFHIGDDNAGLLQTVFLVSYTIFAPLFGYLGDRYNRKYIMASGIFLWSLSTLVGSFMTNFYVFLLFRALVGIGEVNFSTISPTIISDLFVSTTRSKILAAFYFAIPVGSGLGYIVGSVTSNITGSWQWGLRVTPVLSCIGIFLVTFVMKEPVRGEKEGTENLETTSWKEDLKYLVKNRSFMLSTFGFTCVSFAAGALSWFGPKFVYLGVHLQSENTTTEKSLAFSFGLITMLAGIIGLTLGAVLSHVLITRYPKVDPLICGTGLLVSAPLILASTFVVIKSTVSCYALLFFGQVSLNLNWAIVADILLYVVIPTRRSTAGAVQILISHTFGDAGSPYLIGLISELLKKFFSHHDYEEKTIPYLSLQYALIVTCLVEVLGGLFFIFTSFYVHQDRLDADQIIRGEDTSTQVEVKKK